MKATLTYLSGRFNHFNRFPRSREPLIYRVDSVELRQHLLSAIPLEFDGKQFHRKR